MPHKMSRIVASIVLSSLATAGLAGPSTKSSTTQQTVQTNLDYWQSQNGPSGFGQRVSSRAKTEGGQTFTSFGDFLQAMSGNTAK